MDLPNYVKGDDTTKENFIEELIQTLIDNLSNNGFVFPSLTTAQINAIAPSMPIGTFWYNNTLNKGQIKVGNPAVIETITSV